MASTSFLVRLGTFVRFSHTVFALPFALGSMLVAGKGHVSLGVLGWILVCMVATRTAAMCFNRLVDWEIDKENPRTQDRHRLISKGQGWVVWAICSIAAIAAAGALNPFCLYWSPLMLAVVFFYSLTKRFTAFAHAFLGLALGLAPEGAWAAVRGNLFDSPEPFILGCAVLFWTFGFDLIYSTLDAEFDRRKDLHSFPSRYGIPQSLRLAKILHILAVLAFILFGIVANLGLFYWTATITCGIALLWEHRLASNLDPGSINKAFFQINALVSVALFFGIALHYWIGKATF